MATPDLEMAGTNGSKPQLNNDAFLKDNDNDSTNDINIVDWDGPDDPSNPLNWSPIKKNLHIGVVSIFTLSA